MRRVALTPGPPVLRHAPSTDSGTVESLLDIGRQLVPKNIIMAAATSQYLGVIAFAIVFAIILTALGPPAEPLIRVIEIANDAIMAMVWALDSLHCGALHMLARACQLPGKCRRTSSKCMVAIASTSRCCISAIQCAALLLRDAAIGPARGSLHLLDLLLFRSARACKALLRVSGAYHESITRSRAQG